MYTVYRNNRKVTKLMFSTYEKARQFVRKNIRKNVAQAAYNKRALGSPHIVCRGAWDFASRNPPNITMLGYEIRKTFPRALRRMNEVL